MKSKKITIFPFLTVMLILLFGYFATQAQIQFEGYVNQGEGIAGWNANGSGPEPAAIGHLVPAPGFTNQYYYGSSHDYITENPDHACAHFLPGPVGFPQFEQALAENGYTIDQVKIKYGLTTLGDDLEGIDWFFFDNYNYSNYYDVTFTFELNGQLLLEGFFDYANMYINTVSGNFHTESGYSPLYNVATDDIMIEIADAFLADLDGKEIKVHYESTYGQQFMGNGRTGAYYNVLNGILTKGNPELPFQGLNDDHEGFAGWDADGTGPEPYGNGHGTQMYYGASLDYDDIDPDPAACLGHFLEGAEGFFNTLLQLQYRGYEIGDLKLKLGLNSLGPDVFGEDWGTENGHPWNNYYNNNIVFELNEEPILMALMDTNKLVSYPSKWISETGIGKLYDISQNASAEAQLVAQSLLRDVGTHYLKLITDNIQYVTSFSGNGRDGGFWEIVEGSIGGVHEQATFIAESAVSGIWSPQGSPYFVDGHLTIENGQTLTIEPGVKVAVRGPYQFNVYGNVMAEGTEEENILFTHSNPNLMWDGFGYQGALGDTSALSIFSHCVFEHGLAQGADHENCGGMFAVKHHSKLELYNSTFRHNIATIDGGYPPSGGAIALWNSSPLIQNCIFYDNFGEYGGAIFSYSYSNPIISNCLFHDNHAIQGGAISYFEYGNGVLINNTIADNSGEYGGALFFYWHSNPQVINNIIWGNSAVVGNQVYFTSIGPSYPGFYYNNIEGGHEGFSGGSYVEYLFNIDDDPAFVGESFEFPYSLQYGSPCMDAGTPDTSAWYMTEYLPETCICGSPRIYGDRIDMGAFEWPLSPGIDNLNDHDAEPLTLYPNPVREQLFLNFTLEKGSKVSIEFYNITGALISQIELGRLPAGEHLQNWNASGLPEGIYICRLNIGNNVLTAKWVKAN